MMTKFDEIKALDDQYFMNTYNPFDISIERGDGCKLYDTEGREYVDFLAGIAVNALGYNSPIINKAIKKQIKKVMLVSNYFYTEQRGLLARELIKGTHLGKAFFSNSGAEANECAIKLTRKYMKVHNMPDRYKILTATNSFHGRTLTTVTATGQIKYNEPFQPLPKGFEYVEFNNIEALKAALSAKDVAGFMIECIQGEGGVVPATQEYIKAARDITRKNNQLLIVDEIQTGATRTGTLYAFSQYRIKPDIVTLAKGIGGGFPIGATLATDNVASAFAKGDHGTTFGANPLACAVSYAVIKKLKSKAMREQVMELSDHFMNKLNDLKSYPFVHEIRGKGLMLGVQIDKSVSAKDIVLSMLDKGFIINTCGENVLRFVPPLIITKEEINAMMSALVLVLDQHKWGI